MTRWLAYGLLSLSLAAAVLLKGGVYPQQWQWSALGIAVGSILLLASSRAFPADRHEPVVSNVLLSLLLAGMVFQLVPLPMSLVHQLSPHRWQALVAARAATGQNPFNWAALSLAPMATLERLLDVVPAMAVFVAARQMGASWRDRMWIAAAPVVIIAGAESVVGLLQFYFMRGGGLKIGSATGTYVNRNHFAGLLELAFPLALMWAISVWRNGVTRFDQPASVAVRAALLLGVATGLLAGIVVSLSRMGFLSTLIAAGAALLLVLLSRHSNGHRTWRWLIPFALLFATLWFLPTRELTVRLAGMAATEEGSTDNRIEIWRDTLHMMPAYRWVGSGLGAYEKGMYGYKVAAPTNTLDFAHNDYLQILAELGVIGGVLAGGLLAWILWRAGEVVIWKRGSENWELAVGLFAALLSLSVHNLADFNLYIPANALAFAWLAGLAVSPGLRES